MTVSSLLIRFLQRLAAGNKLETQMRKGCVDGSQALEGVTLRALVLLRRRLLPHEDMHRTMMNHSRGQDQPHEQNRNRKKQEDFMRTWACY